MTKQRPFTKSETIETWFLGLDKSRFPGDIDFVAIYKAAKDVIVRTVLPEIKAIVSTIDKNIYLNDHGPQHVRTVMDRASRLFQGVNVDLNPMEGFILLMAILLHDAGHVICGRKEHEQKVANLLNDLYGSSPLSSVDKALQRIIYSIAKAHAGTDDPIGQLTEQMSWASCPIRVRFLAAVLRISDELAEDCLRASSFLLLSENPFLSSLSKLFHEYSDRLTSCDIDIVAHEVSEPFMLSKKDVLNTLPYKSSVCFLLDYIYERSIKTFCEIIYCNRFLPEALRIYRLSIKIEFVDERTYEEFRPCISYRLQESGYPSYLKKDIFEMASEDLVDSTGKHIDGKYLCGELKNSIDNE